MSNNFSKSHATWWPVLLELRERCSGLTDFPTSILIGSGEKKLRIIFNENEIVHHFEENIFLYKSIFKLKLIQNINLSIDDINFIKIYAPYCFFSIHAQRKQQTATVIHLAQSLDGKIATSSGSSMGIGNAENLDHAHRMRALCDAVLIGSGTLKADKARLNVRRVEGVDPLRVIVSSGQPDMSSLQEASDAEIMLISAQGQHLERVDSQQVKPDTPAKKILDILFKKGIYSAYIEGGAYTASSFLQEEMVDILQLHLSPIVLGSGISGLQFEEITELSEAMRFKRHDYFAVGDAMMFVGEL